MMLGRSLAVKPSLDLTLISHFGDDKNKGTVHWAGAKNLSSNVSSEVIDIFTYGIHLGVAAHTNNPSPSHSNVDEFGVHANARFIF